MSYVRLLGIGSLCALAIAPASHAQESPVDPDSPAGVQYQLPLDQARKDAAGGDAGGHRSEAPRSGPAPLFGAGIVAVKSDRSSGGGRAAGAEARGSRDGEAGGGARASGGDRGADDGSGSDAKVTQAATGSPDPDGGSATWTVAAIVLAVLAAGTLLGLLLRRVLRQPAE